MTHQDDWDRGHHAGMAQQRVDWQPKIDALEDDVKKLKKSLDRMKNKFKVASDKLEQFVELVSEAAPLGWAAAGDQERAYDWERKASELLNEK